MEPYIRFSENRKELRMITNPKNRIWGISKVRIGFGKFRAPVQQTFVLRSDGELEELGRAKIQKQVKSPWQGFWDNHWKDGGVENFALILANEVMEELNFDFFQIEEEYYEQSEAAGYDGVYDVVKDHHMKFICGVMRGKTNVAQIYLPSSMVLVGAIYSDRIWNICDIPAAHTIGQELLVSIRKHLHRKNLEALKIEKPLYIEKKVTIKPKFVHPEDDDIDIDIINC